jgi:hypothetical protein
MANVRAIYRFVLMADFPTNFPIIIARRQQHPGLSFGGFLRDRAAIHRHRNDLTLAN